MVFYRSTQRIIQMHGLWTGRSCGTKMGTPTNLSVILIPQYRATPEEIPRFHSPVHGRNPGGISRAGFIINNFSKSRLQWESGNSNLVILLQVV